MGYYEYKFLKKLYNNKCFRRFLLLGILFLIFILIFSKKCFGFSGFIYNYNGHDYTLPDSPYNRTYNILYKGVDSSNNVQQNRLFLVSSNNPIAFYNAGNTYGAKLYSESTIYLTIYLYYSNTNEFKVNNYYALSPIVRPTNNGVLYDVEGSYFTRTGSTDMTLFLNTLLFTDNDIYWVNLSGVTSDPIYEIPPQYENFPYFLNSDEDIALGEQDLIIMPGDFENSKDITFSIQVKSESSDGQGGVIESWTNLFTPLTLNSSSQFYVGIDESGVGFYYKIPWSFLTNYLEVGKQYDYILAYDLNNERIVNDLYVTYGGLTPEDAIKNSIANQSNLIREQTVIQTEMLETQQETNEKLDDLNNSINDDTITSSASDLPSINVDDPSENGINNIFNLFYNAFCTGNPQNIVFPIPFTNKNITLSPYYVKDMCNNNGAGWVVTFIDAFWQFLVGVYIIKDVSKKINKIKTGDIDNIENNNIKEEML